MPNPDIWLASRHRYNIDANTGQGGKVSITPDRITLCIDLLETLLRSVGDILRVDIVSPLERQERDKLVDDLRFAVRSVNRLLEAFVTPARGDNAS